MSGAVADERPRVPPSVPNQGGPVQRILRRLADVRRTGRGRARLILVAIVALIAVSVGTATTPANAAAPAKAKAAVKATPADFFSGGLDAAGFRAYTDGEMKAAQAALDRLLAVKGKRTIQNTYDAYNMICVHADNAAYVAGLMEAVHPD